LRSRTSTSSSTRPSHAAQQLLDAEERRVKLLTESVLYDFLPAALKAVSSKEPIVHPSGRISISSSSSEAGSGEVDASMCRKVASAALSVACLLNAPPGFLEFLLCVPWEQAPALCKKQTK
jgi:hypothetical protein